MRREMKWDETRREMRWDEMRWDEMRWESWESWEWEREIDVRCEMCKRETRRCIWHLLFLEESCAQTLSGTNGPRKRVIKITLVALHETNPILGLSRAIPCLLWYRLACYTERLHKDVSGRCARHSWNFATGCLKQTHSAKHSKHPRATRSRRVTTLASFRKLDGI